MWMVTSISCAVAGQRFVDGVVDYFVDQVVQPHFAGGADIHGGPQAHRFQAFQHFDTRGIVNFAVVAGIYFVGIIVRCSLRSRLTLRSSSA